MQTPGTEPSTKPAAERATAANGTTTVSPSVWRESWVLAAHFGRQRWFGLVIVSFGLAAALADSLGVGFAVILLFALLHQTDGIEDGGGLLSDVEAWLTNAVGDSTALIGLALFAVILINAGLVFANNICSAVLLNRVAEGIRDRVHEVYITVSYRFLQRREHGDLIHTLANESWTVSMGFYSLSRMAISACGVLVFGAGVWVLSPLLGATALAGLLATLGLSRVLSKILLRLSKETLTANQVLSDRMLMSLTGMRTLRLFARERHMRARFTDASAEVRRLAVRGEMVQAMIGPIRQVGNLAVLLIMVLVASLNGIETPVLIATVLMLFRLQPYLTDIELQRLALARMSASMRDVREMLDRADKTWPRDGTIPFTGLTTEIRFHDVSFSHVAEGEGPLAGVNFSIQQGRLTLIEGPSGAGKSTILNLILRLYEPDAGRITVDGRDIADLTRESWLARIGVAGQDVELIEGTVLQNMRFGQADATLDEVRDACRVAEILDEIERLPDGFDTSIGASGISLSGGQRQRLGLARALLRKPEVLLLDEALSAIGPDVEDRILANVRKIMAGRTVIMVSHRPGVDLGPHDRIAIRDGRIVEPS